MHERCHLRRPTDKKPSNKELKDNTLCDKSHEHLPLRGSGPGGSRTAQSAKYSQDLCEDYLDEMIPKVSDGGRIVDNSGFLKENSYDTKGLDFQKISKALIVLKKVAAEMGLSEQWAVIVDPWVAGSGLTPSPQVASSTLATMTTTRAASGITDVFEGIIGDLPEKPWQEMKYSKDNTHWQAAAQQRHLHRRHKNQSLGVASVDLSGPHAHTPQPGKRNISSSPAYYFLVLSVKLAEENVPVQVEEAEAPVEPPMPLVEVPAGPIPELDPELAAEDNAEPPEQWLKPIL